MTDPVVSDNPTERRFKITSDGTLLGHARYVDKGGRRIFVHTEIDPAQEGHGYASTLVRAALDDARSNDTLIVPLCPYVAEWIERHPDYADLIDMDLLARMESTQ
ncbi:MAG: GNAT family N-acetyltransferase [Acidimicrobiia bacterium]